MTVLVPAAADRLPALEGTFAYPAAESATKGDMGGGRHSVAIMGGSGSQYVRAGFQIPDGWNSVNVVMTYGTTVAGTVGTNVRYWTYVSVAETGVDLSSNRVQGWLDVDTSLTTNVLQPPVTVFSGVSVAPRELLSVTIGRNAGHAEDTFNSGTVGIAVIALERAS